MRPPPSLLRPSLLLATLLALPSAAQQAGDASRTLPFPAEARQADDAASGTLPFPAAEGAEVEALPVVSRSERIEPGGGAHSPSTVGQAWNAGANARHAAGVHGAQGLLEVGSALLGPVGVLRFGIAGEYAESADFPVAGAHNLRTAGTFAASYVPLSWLELSASYAASSNSNPTTRPVLLQALGDVTVGVKAALVLTPWLAGGLELTGLAYSGVGNQGPGGYVLGLAPRGLLSMDVRELTGSIPLRLHLNLGGRLDGTGAQSPRLLTPAEEYALSVNRFHRLTYGLGAEVPLPWVTPFAEHAIAYPLNAGVLLDTGGSLVTTTQVMRHTLTAGARLTALENVTLTVAGQFGLTPRVAPSVPATPPFSLLMAASFNVDPFQRGGTRVVEVVRERTVEVARMEQQVGGVVLDKATRKPLPGVIVSVVGSPQLPVASDADGGRFLTHAVSGEKVTLAVQKDGYRAHAQEVVLTADGARVELLLEREIKKARLDVVVLAKGRPIPAQLALGGPEQRAVTLEAGGSAPAPVDVAAGTYTLAVSADGFLAQTRDVQVSPGGVLPVRFELEAEPRKRLVILKEDRLEILQQVRFTSGRATLHPDSRELLKQVLDAVVRNGIKRLRVEGHTDNRGGKRKNLLLSHDRAQAVADVLVELGMDRSRLDVEGHGDSRPIAPNVTSRGRQLNRRVDFMIVER